jgi:hypothetical protein
LLSLKNIKNSNLYVIYRVWVKPANWNHVTIIFRGLFALHNSPFWSYNPGGFFFVKRDEFFNQMYRQVQSPKWLKLGPMCTERTGRRWASPWNQIPSYMAGKIIYKNMNQCCLDGATSFCGAGTSTHCGSGSDSIYC